MPPTAPPDVPLDRSALFLDFDGTLVDIAERPDAVAVARGTIGLLAALQQHLGGALAIVSGRDLADLDRYLAPLQLCAAGVHGLVRRDARGGHHEEPTEGAGGLDRFKNALVERLAGCEGLIVEEKTGSVALHYRARPDLEPTCAAAVASAVVAAEASNVTVMRGKMVIEVRLGRHTKGSAIAAFLEEPPFAGRLPVFAGDDVTDEDGFATVTQAGGVAIKVGAGESLAGHRLASPAALREWLGGLVDSATCVAREER